MSGLYFFLLAVGCVFTVFIVKAICKSILATWYTYVMLAGLLPHPLLTNDRINTVGDTLTDILKDKGTLDSHISTVKDNIAGIRKMGYRNASGLLSPKPMTIVNYKANLLSVINDSTIRVDTKARAIVATYNQYMVSAGLLRGYRLTDKLAILLHTVFIGTK